MRRPASKGLRLLGAALCITWTAGCSGAVDGGAVREQPVDLSQVLPNPDQVLAAVGSPLDATGPPRVGGIDLLPNGFRDASDVTPLDCLGAATPLMRVVYQGADVRNVGLQDYARYGQGFTVSSVHAGVVRLASDAEAATLFDAFAAQWTKCAGTTVTVHVTPTSELVWTVTDVRRDDAVLSATVLHGEAGLATTFPAEHSVGLAGDFIVDVDVAVTDPRPERRVPTGRAVRLVRTILADIAEAN